MCRARAGRSSRTPKAGAASTSPWHRTLRLLLGRRADHRPGRRAMGAASAAARTPTVRPGQNLLGLAACVGLSVADVESIAFSAALPLCQCLWMLWPLF